MTALEQELLAFIAEHLDADQTEHLVGWIAWRVKRPASLAGADSPARITRAISWCTPTQQRALLSWLYGRLASGGGYSPGS